ncbi:MAG: periplasmic protein TonB [Azoarcus sp.]|nr:periplasmic protein TonB [Azoarcus sp.]
MSRKNAHPFDLDTLVGAHNGTLTNKWELKNGLNYPDAARGRLYGSLLLLVAIRADGSVERVEVQRSSGEPVLDEAAKRIVTLAAPFSSFPNDIRADTDIVEIVRTWTFTNADRLTAH